MKGRYEAYDIAVVGGGASGIFAALFAAKAGAGVCILERNQRIGKKILMTGNGRCNLTHSPLTEEKHYFGSGKSRVKNIYDRFGVQDTLDYFKSIGLITKSREGYVYPVSDQASSVLDVLRYAIRDAGVDVLTEYEVKDIAPKEGGYAINSEIMASKVIICAGGMAAPKTGSDGCGFDISRRLGLKVIKPLPALVKLVTSDKRLSICDGVRARGLVTVRIGQHTYSDEGEIQFTKDGISGIPVFNVSRHVARALDEGYDLDLSLDMAVFFTKDEYISYLRSRLMDLHDTDLTMEEFLTGSVHKKLSLYALKTLEVSPQTYVRDVDPAFMEKYAELMKNIRLPVKSSYGFEHAQVTCGGIDFGEVDESLQSIRYPGLYFAGEILDIDGICGGYNLQWAWSSGAVAGMSASGI